MSSREFYLRKLGFTDFVDVAFGERSAVATQWCLDNIGPDACIRYTGSGVDPLSLIAIAKHAVWGSITVSPVLRRFAFMPTVSVGRIVEFKLLFGSNNG